MQAYKITNPLRFFGFFGLFIIFMFLAVKSCSDKKQKTEFVKADEIVNASKENLKKGNSKELEEFIEDVKENIGKEESSAVIKVQKKRVLAEKTVKVVAKKVTPKAKKPVATRVKSLNVNSVVKRGSGDQIDAFSKIQLKKDVKTINAGGSGAVTVYGSYFPGEPKTKGFLRAAKIKNELIRLGLKSSRTVYILPESQPNTTRFGRMKFGK